MAYHFTKTVVNKSHQAFVELLKTELYMQGFTILCVADMKKILKDYMKNEPMNYEVISVIHPYLYGEIMNEGSPGYILPCEITVSMRRRNSIEVIALNTLKLISDGSRNPTFQNVADEITRRLDSVIEHVAHSNVGALTDTEMLGYLNVDDNLPVN